MESLNGLGFPGRRLASAQPRLFAFEGALWKHLQPLPPNLTVGSSAELFLNDVIGPVSLFGLQDVPSDRPGYQIRKLKARGIALLI